MRATRESTCAIGPQSDLSHCCMFTSQLWMEPKAVYSCACVCLYVCPPCTLLMYYVAEHLLLNIDMTLSLSLVSYRLDSATLQAILFSHMSHGTIYFNISFTFTVTFTDTDTIYSIQ